MGITLFYKGRIKSAELLPKLIEEVKDIAMANKWHYHGFNDTFPENSLGKESFDDELYGISFTPPGCETLDLVFLSNGKLASVLNFCMNRHSPDFELIDGTFAKTQFAGFEVHKLLVHMLDHISKKYLDNFEMMDEANYWETRDEEVLRKNFELLDNLINSFQNRLETIPMNENETLEEYIRRIAENVNKKIR